MPLTRDEFREEDGIYGAKLRFRVSDSRPVCGAKLRNKPGQFCGGPPISKMNGRCRIHGGRGSGRPVVGGRWSHAMGRMSEAYAEALQDDSLGDLRPGLAALDAIVQRAAARVDQYDSPEFRRRALALYSEGESAELGQLLAAGVEEDKAIQNLADTVIEYQKRSEAWWDMKLKAKNAVSIQDLNRILIVFSNIVMDELIGAGEESLARRVAIRIEEKLTGPSGISLLHTPTVKRTG